MNASRRIYDTADDVAALSERLRPTLLSWARRRFPSVAWDHEEVLQDVLARLTLDTKAHGSEDHIRACLYRRFHYALLNRLRWERARLFEDAMPLPIAFEQVPDPDTSIDPLACAVRAFERETLAAVLAPYTEIEQRLIRLRYRDGVPARKNDGVISRVECADLLGITLAELRAMEHRVFCRLAGRLVAARESHGA